MKLYLVHCGFYDNESGHGIYESHVNIFVAAQSFDKAKTKAKQHSLFLHKKMHVDGIFQVDVVDGYQITLQENTDLNGKSSLQALGYKELAPKPVMT